MTLMTDEDREAIKELLMQSTIRNTETPAIARASLVRSGIYVYTDIEDEHGRTIKLHENYGG